MLNKIICFIFGHDWQTTVSQGTETRTCYRCGYSNSTDFGWWKINGLPR